MCRAVNLRTEKYDIYIGRAGHGQEGLFGNPFRVGIHGARGECVKLFRDWFYSEHPRAVDMRKLVQERIKPNDRLGCFCKPNACHGDIIAEFVNNNYEVPTNA